MRLAIVTDIHGNLAALDAVVAGIQRRGADQIVNLGGSLSGPLLPLETAQFLMAEGWPSLAGNHERKILTRSPQRRGASDEYAHSQLTMKEFGWLNSLAPGLRLAPEVFLCHGTPSCSGRPHETQAGAPVPREEKPAPLQAPDAFVERVRSRPHTSMSSSGRKPACSPLLR
ncbi:MAG: metallophosphoesterase family protein [Xenophilus sp.]